MIQYKYKNILNIIVFKTIILVYIMLTNLIQIKYSILYDLKKLKLGLSYYTKAKLFNVCSSSLSF